jgi:hypothetical protein
MELILQTMRETSLTSLIRIIRLNGFTSEHIQSQLVRALSHVVARDVQTWRDDRDLLLLEQKLVGYLTKLVRIMHD